MSKRGTASPPRRAEKAKRSGRAAVGTRPARSDTHSAGLIERLLLGLPALDLRGHARRLPTAAWLCALVACLNALCWSFITPAFEVPDEPAHFAYVKQLVDTGSKPTSRVPVSSREIQLAMQAEHYYHVRQQPENRPMATQAEQAEFQRASTEAIGANSGSSAAGVATEQPPLYYALEAIPYSFALHNPVTDRLQLMRAFSALFAALSALFVYLFVRETLPGEPWAWVVGGLSVALMPLLGFMSGSVNPDALLFAVCAAVFYCFARAFRRGLTSRMAVAIGAVTAIGVLSKLNFLGLLPGILLGLVLLSIREGRGSPRTALRPLALALAIGLSPGALLIVKDALAHQPLLGPLAGNTALDKGSLIAQLNYIWQFYLPRIPGTVNDFPGLFTARQFWFNGLVGLFGWRDTMFPGWVYDFALLPAGAIVFLLGRALFQRRALLGGRIAELLVYAAISIGVMGMVGAASYGTFPGIDAEYFEVRYLFPMLALLGAILALAARGAGRRWGPAAGALILTLFLAQDILSQMLVVGRYYG